MTWQPIATAPKDGTPIIAYQPGGTYRKGLTFPASVGIAYWWHGNALNEAGWNGPLHPRDYPTLWMPVPRPPRPGGLQRPSHAEDGHD